MSSKAGVRTSALAAALTVVLVMAATAIAAGGVAPTLLSPNHKHVAPGHVRLVVGIPLKAAKHGVFVTVSSKRKLDKYGHLKDCGSLTKCDFVGPTHWKGHKYSWVANGTFPGFWAVTPGKYYWQAHYYTAGDTAVYWGRIGWFIVK
jgi:hypothetical protein